MVSSEFTRDEAIVAEQRTFDETKAGVKGLVESGITSVPRIFNHQSNAAQSDTSIVSTNVPTIDLQGVRYDATLRSQAIHKIKHGDSSSRQIVVNHGIPIETLDEALVGARAFFDQDVTVKQHYYTREMAGKKVVYHSNFDLYTRGTPPRRRSHAVDLCPYILPHNLLLHTKMVSSELSHDEAAIAAERRAFDETKAGVKGLVDGSGITSVPRIFNHQSNATQADTVTATTSVPTIDLQGIRRDATIRSQAVHKIIHASQTWGFFQVVNHGIPIDTLDEALMDARAFFDQDEAIKKPYYTRDTTGKKVVVYSSNFDLHTRRGAADWRDSFKCKMAPNPAKKEDLPDPCCADGLVFNYHYYPPCPEPEKTMGTTKHRDNDYITLLLQDKEIGGLQVMYQGQWLDVPPVPGAFVVNIGDFLQFLCLHFPAVMKLDVLLLCEGSAGRFG